MPKGRLDHTALRFGQVIRHMRNELRWSLHDLGSATDMHPDYLGLVERGYNVPSLNTILAIAEAFGVSAGDLLAPVEEERRKLRPVPGVRRAEPGKTG